MSLGTDLGLLTRLWRLKTLATSFSTERAEGNAGKSSKYNSPYRISNFDNSQKQVNVIRPFRVFSPLEHPSNQRPPCFCELACICAVECPP